MVVHSMEITITLAGSDLQRFGSAGHGKQIKEGGGWGEIWQFHETMRYKGGKGLWYITRSTESVESYTLPCLFMNSSLLSAQHFISRPAATWAHLHELDQANLI